MVARVYKGRYFPHSSILNAPIGRSSSFIWRSLLWGRELLSSGLRWRVGDGSSISLYTDAWIPILHSFRIMSPPLLPLNCLVSELIADGGRWNLELIYSSFWTHEADAICSIPLPLNPAPDRLCWHFTKNGVYSVKSGYHVVVDSRSTALGNVSSSTSSTDDLIWKTLWHLKVPAASRVFFWRALQGILPCSLNLFCRHLLSFPICPRCHLHAESILHALWSCSKTKQVWVLTPFNFGVGSWGCGSFADLFRHAISVLTTTELELIVWLCRRIWQARNEEVFQHKFISPSFLFSHVQSLMSEFHSAFSPLPNASITVCPLERWALPQFPFLKLNVDGAVNLYNGTRGLGAVLRNERGDLLLAVCKGMFGHFSPKATEIYAAALGLQAIFHVGFHLDNIILEMDAQTVVHDLLSINHDWSVECALLEEASEDIFSLLQFSYLYIYS